ncbi:hypothetical protein OUZ56_008937 [Daphnia magna]|uniref:Uncharacterized protein n=1 Tax=Daphnia magna TaxID=35525 RepID=A0ABR0AEH8_9CRUS|nr:hypothetical protein OUZ56_008937 [Daphnia magna]
MHGNVEDVPLGACLKALKRSRDSWFDTLWPRAEIPLMFDSRVVSASFSPNEMRPSQAISGRQRVLLAAASVWHCISMPPRTYRLFP